MKNALTISDNDPPGELDRPAAGFGTRARGAAVFCRFRMHLLLPKQSARGLAHSKTQAGKDPGVDGVSMVQTLLVKNKPIGRVD